MNILLLCDLEGIPGVTSIDQIDRTNPSYQGARRLMTGVINKVAAYCFECGADRVSCFDGHGGPSMNNVIDEELTVPKLTKEELEEKVRLGNVDFVIDIGTHARAGTIGGFLDHTMSSKAIFSQKINGREVGELAIHAYFLSEYGVPTALTISDTAACTQAKEYIENIVTAPVKHADTRNFCVDFPDADGIIREGVKTAFAVYKTVECPRVSLPATVEITYYRTDMCEAVLARCQKNGISVERVDARTLRRRINAVTALSDLNI